MNTCLAQVCHVSVPESPIRLVVDRYAIGDLIVDHLVLNQAS
jgi:hypothetical protein